MKQFTKYAYFYDTFYQKKDYAGEVEYLKKIIKKYSPGVKSILDLGCGTGKHAILLAAEGYDVTGVDASEEMLEQANDNATFLSGSIRDNIRFCCDDIGNLKLNRNFDFIYSLFHVISYQTTNNAIQNTMKSVHGHLKKGGFFVFDVWYGPGVLADKPEYRNVEFLDDKKTINKTASPTLLPNDNLVKIEYTITVRPENTTIVEEHNMRYYFKPELDLILSNNGMEIVDVFDGFTNKEVDENTWSATFIARSID